MFNLLYTKYRNYENIENTANIIYDYSIYDDINLYGDWQQTDDSIFSKQVLNISSNTDLNSIFLVYYILKYFIMKVVPFPSFDSTFIYPLLFSIIDFAKDKPIPQLSLLEFFPL